MDKPQYQVMGNSGESFRYMAYPFQRQQLQLLYPGRPMEQGYHYSGDNIPNPNPVGLRVTKEVENTLEDVSRMENEALARRYGGIHNIINYPAVEPDAIIEDPRLTGLTLESTIGLNPNSESVYSPYDNLSGTYETGEDVVDYVRSKEEGRDRRMRFDDNKLPRYNWEKLPKEEYHSSPNRPLHNTTQKKTLNKKTYPNIQNYQKPYFGVRNMRESYTRASMKKPSSNRRTPIKRRRRTVGGTENSNQKEVLNCYTDSEGVQTCTKMTCGSGTCKKQTCDEYGENCTGEEDCGQIDGVNYSDQCIWNNEFKWYTEADIVDRDNLYVKTNCSPSIKTCLQSVCDRSSGRCENRPGCDYNQQCLNGNQNMKIRIDCDDDECTVYKCGDDKCIKQEGCDSSHEDRFGGVYTAKNCPVSEQSDCTDSKICNRSIDPIDDEFEGDVTCSGLQCTELYCNDDNKTCKIRTCDDGKGSCSSADWENCDYNVKCDNGNGNGNGNIKDNIEDKIKASKWYKKIPTWGWIVGGVVLLLLFILLIWGLYKAFSGKKPTHQYQPLSTQSFHNLPPQHVQPTHFTPAQPTGYHGNLVYDSYSGSWVNPPSLPPHRYRIPYDSGGRGHEIMEGGDVILNFGK